MANVRGIGGIFFKSDNAENLRAWYKRHLGIDSGDYGKMFRWRSQDNPEQEHLTVWAVFPAKSSYFGSDSNRFMMNYIVDDLHATIAELRADGVAVDEKIEESEFGKFGWITDPDGNRIELWEPPKKA